MSVAQQNDALKTLLLELLATHSDEHRLSDFLTPTLVDSAATEQDLVSDLSTHYIAVVHKLAAAHDAATKTHTHDVLKMVESLILDSLAMVRQQIMYQPEFYTMVRDEARRVQPVD